MTTRNLAAEWVFPGHPDKLSDAIADALVQEASGRQQRALCALEVAVTRGVAYVTGRLGCKGAEKIDVESIARDVYRSAGYGGDWTPAPDDLEVVANLCLCPLDKEEQAFRAVADDQTISVGYACDSPGTNWLPPEHWLAGRIGRRLHQLRIERPNLQLGPDGKVIVQLEIGEQVTRLSGFSTSLQQKLEGDPIDLVAAVRKRVEEELETAVSAIPGLEPRLPSDWKVNGGGNFAVGGPEADNGLSGKKLVVDAYGPRVQIGGGALSGKDFYKADRAGAIIARRLARVIVQTGTARECTATVAFQPGDEEARIVSVRNETGRELDAGFWVTLFDNTLAGSGDRYTNVVDLVDVARFGHFTSADRPWEVLGFDSRPAEPAEVLVVELVGAEGGPGEGGE